MRLRVQNRPYLPQLLSKLLPSRQHNSQPSSPQKKTNIHNRGQILLRICQAMILVICVQSFKIFNMPDFSKSHSDNIGFVDVQFINSNAQFLHLLNMLFHVLLFSWVLFLLKQARITLAKYVLLLAFCSYILLASVLWQYDLHLQYYFLLSMFISCYIFDKQEKQHLIITISIQIGLFIGLHHFLPPLNELDSLMHANGAYQYFHHISQVNTYVFAMSCVICALFIRKILASNWQILSQFEARQTVLLKKLFPAQLMPSLLLAQNDIQPSLKSSHLLLETPEDDSENAMQTTQQMGVVFLDICQFTQLATSKLSSQESWRTIYHLFAKYDLAIAQLDAKRIKTNGDQYILLVGLNSYQIATNKTALQTVEACKQLLLTSSVNVKIGAAFGMVTCGIFDPNNPNFDIWGETVIRAARLEAIAKPNSIVVDAYLHSLTKNKENYTPGHRQNLKGLGEQLTYQLTVE